MSHDAASGSQKPIIAAVGTIMVIYALAALAGWPQAATETIRAAAAHHNDSEPAEHPASESDPEQHPADSAGSPANHDKDDHGTAGEHGGNHKEVPPFTMVLPFALLLACIAALPLIPKVSHWWEHNSNRFLVALVLGLVTLCYYLVLHEHPIEGHFPAHKIVSPGEGALSLHMSWAVFENAILVEYIPFIMLLFSLYTISGGIRIACDLPARPLINVAFIATGGILASFIGTTGAAMLLIRPLIETNNERKYVTHTVVFFIFVVCNCGGCLLPIGDPPLFLGYLRGVPFLWTMKLFWPWLFVNGCLLGIYLIWDGLYSYRKETVKDITYDETHTRPLRITGLWPNSLLLLGIVLAVALLDPSKPVPGTHWHPWLYLREIVQLGLVGLSLVLGSSEVRRQNRFNYHAIVEVAALFFGIFICMQPALQILNVEGPNLGIDSAMRFFWATGGLSAVLDNAPTYVVFFETAKTLGGGTAASGHVAELFLVGISLGAVFMGAMTYIGNGPNFMVKAIAEGSGIKMPSFFGYMLYSIGILLPVLVVMSFIFLRPPAEEALPSSSEHAPAAVHDLGPTSHVVSIVNP